MSTFGAFYAVAALLAFSLAAAYWQIDRARRHEAMRDRIIRAANEHAEAAREVDDLELLYSLPDYDRAAAVIDEGLSGLFEELGPPPAHDPAWEAGKERLWDAVLDQQDEGGEPR